MNTLQLYISKSSGQHAPLAEINPSAEGRRAAADMKAAVSLIDYPPTSKLIFYIIVNHAGGYAVHIVRAIPPSRPNHLDATIYIDNNLDIMTDDLAAIIHKVSTIVAAKAVTQDDMAELRRLFAREYDLRDKAPRIKASRGRDFAYMSYGGDRTLDDIIADGLYNAAWSDYKAVVLLDEAVAPFADTMIDLDNADEEPQADTDVSDRQSAAASHTYVFELPVLTPDGRTSFEFEIESSKPLRRSPVDGYEIAGRLAEGTQATNRLRKSRHRSLYARVERWIWAAAGLAAGILIMLLVGLFDGGDAPAAGDKTAPAAQVSQKAADEAVSYLDNHRTWNRNDMEKIDGLRGLFDDLDNYRLDELTGKWAERLDASKNFAKVVKAASKSKTRHIDPRREQGHSPRYNREGDNNISWLGYTYWIDP